MTAAETSSPNRVYAGLSAAERVADRRERLLDAALEVFGTSGYAATSADRICKAAGVSTKHFYQHYSNKEALLLDLYEAITAGSSVTAADSLAGGEESGFASRVTGAVRSYLEPILNDPRVARVAFVEVVGVSPRVEARRLQFRSGLIQLFEIEGARAVARNELTPRDFKFLALCFIGAANVVVHDWSIDPSQASAETLLDNLCEVLVRMFVGHST